MLFAVVGIEALALPHILSEEGYVEFEFIKSTTFLFQFLLLGSCSGYLTISTSRGNDNQKSMNFFMLSSLYIIFIATLLSLFYGYYWSLVSLIAMIALVIETQFKSEEKYFFAMAFKPMVSLISIFAVISLSEWEEDDIFMLAILISIVIYIFVFFIKGKLFSELGKLQLDFKAFIEFFVRGLPINSSALLLYAIFYLDRTFIIENYEASAASYSLAFSISQMVFIAINMFSYVNVVDFGKCIRLHPERLPQLLMDKLRSCLLFYGLISCISLIVIGVFIEDFYGFNDLFEFSLVIIVIGGLVNVLISVGSLHTYLKTQRYNVTALALVMLCSYLLNQLLFLNDDFSSLHILLKSYILLLLYSVFSVSIVIYKSVRCDL
ncbi:hypothetical protein EJ063_15210 [Vibrio aquaticus]|uniref:Polysaccharide biosynthesis protein n=1 Tax=Vibrio aquaticus TaxID=2496559 RepID=A0A3S0Q0J3_9VIBR|nr:hypothetical protein [Vibrio aquaticus]RTZ14659.1 hypothetical protein EJ063_15210 [Vibrio aquaticus]